MKTIRKIGVLTSGGDAPGMNACIRAVVRTARYHDVEVAGILRGYEGMINGDIIPLTATSVANIIQRGGTILKTARSKEFMTVEGRKKAYDTLQRNNIDAFIIIGGNGSFTGASVFEKEHGAPSIGVPATIDNDLMGTDFTIGYDTAINTVIHAVDAIRDTAESHDRLFLVEVMGRDSGQIALASGIGVGAEAILLPELKMEEEDLYRRLAESKRKKSSKIIIVAEGDQVGGVFGLAERIMKKIPQYDTKVSVLGHMQRGGAPSCLDRILASELGYVAVEALLSGKKGMMVGQINKEIKFTPFQDAITDSSSKINPTLLKMLDILSL